MISKVLHALSAVAGTALIVVGIFYPPVQTTSKELMTAGSALLGLAGTKYLDKATTLVTALSTIATALATQKKKDSDQPTQPSEKKE